MPIISGGSSGGAATALQAATVALTGGNQTTSSTTFVAVTGATITFVTGAHRVLLLVTATVANSGAGSDNKFDVTVDGTRQGGTSGLLVVDGSANFNDNASFHFLTAALTAASHTFTAQWCVSAGTGTLQASAAQPFTFQAVELYA